MFEEVGILVQAKARGALKYQRELFVVRIGGPKSLGVVRGLLLRFNQDQFDYLLRVRPNSKSGTELTRKMPEAYSVQRAVGPRERQGKNHRRSSRGGQGEGGTSTEKLPARGRAFSESGPVLHTLH